MSGTTAVPTPLSSQDEEHLRILSIVHYVFAGLVALFACFPVIHLVVGIGLLAAGKSPSEGGPPAFLGVFFIGLALVFILLGWSVAALVAYAGRCLARRERHMLCVVVGGLEAAMCVPLGTVLGVLTIIVLMRPSVKQAFGVG